MLNEKTHKMGVGPDLPLDERHLAFVETLPPSAVFLVENVLLWLIKNSSDSLPPVGSCDG